MTDKKPQINRALANRRALAVVLVHDQGNMRVGLHCRLDQMLDKALAGVLARASAGLQNHGRADLVCGGHDRLHLLKIVHVEGRDAITIGCCVIE